MTDNLTKLAFEPDLPKERRDLTDEEKSRWLELAMKPDITELRPYSDSLLKSGVHPMDLHRLFKDNLDILNVGDIYRCLRISRTHSGLPYSLDGVLRCNGA